MPTGHEKLAAGKEVHWTELHPTPLDTEASEATFDQEADATSGWDIKPVLYNSNSLLMFLAGGEWEPFAATFASDINATVIWFRKRT